MDLQTQIPARNVSGSPAKKRNWIAFLPAAVFLAVASIFLISLLWPVDPQKLPSMLIGKAAPKTNLPALEGYTENGVPVRGITPADLAQGKPVIVNFWQSSCAPCVAEHPLLIILAEKTGVPLVGINYQDPPSGARRFLNRYGNPFSAIGADTSGRTAIEWGVYGMPETFILDGKGTVLYKHIGEITPDVLDKVLIPIVEKAH
jgi:cytochrome c biogenesis protein CcmG/thiol:disulfide interchange protein DsbE